MSTIAKSPKKVARAAYRIAKSMLPQYAYRFSPKKVYSASTIYLPGIENLF
jgi:hypothetical protein